MLLTKATWQYFGSRRDWTQSPTPSCELPLVDIQPLHTFLHLLCSSCGYPCKCLLLHRYLTMGGWVCCSMNARRRTNRMGEILNQDINQNIFNFFHAFQRHIWCRSACSLSTEEKRQDLKIWLGSFGFCTCWACIGWLFLGFEFCTCCKSLFPFKKKSIPYWIFYIAFAHEEGNKSKSQLLFP